MILESYQEAKKRFLSGDFSVENFFMQNDFVLEYAYCKLLQGDAEAAKEAFMKIAQGDFRADWGKKLVQFVQGNVLDLPSYFQIRNFLEIDISLLIQAGQAQFVEDIISGADLFYSINPESYKFISRAMLYNDFIDVALFYLLKAKDKFYCDPEMHLMLANCYMKKDEKILARESLKSCLRILPEYLPAKKLLDSIS